MHFRILAKTEKAPPERSLNFFSERMQTGGGGRQSQTAIYGMSWSTFRVNQE